MNIVTIILFACASIRLEGDVSADFRMAPPDDVELAVDDTDEVDAEDDTEEEPGELAVIGLLAESVVSIGCCCLASPELEPPIWVVGEDEDSVVVGLVEVEEATEEGPAPLGDEEIELLPGLKAAAIVLLLLLLLLICTLFCIPVVGDPICSGCCCCDCCCCWVCFLCFLYFTLYML